jgi:hypothetical protein
MPDLIGDPKSWAAAFQPLIQDLENRIAGELQDLPLALVNALDGLQVTITISRKVPTKS